MSEKPAPNLGKQKERVPDDMWLTSRCQTIVNEFNAGTIDHCQAVANLQMVGNTKEQAETILRVHQGRPAVKVKPPKKPNPLRTVKR